MKDAIEFITAFVSDAHGAPTLQYVLDGLNDGEALLAFGCTDEDKGLVEAAHDLVVDWMDAGHVMLADALAAV